MRAVKHQRKPIQITCPWLTVHQKQLSLFESMPTDLEFIYNDTHRQNCFGGCDSNINNDLLQQLVF